MVCVRGVPGVTGTLGKANSHFDPTQTGRGPHHHVEAAADWYSSILLALHLHTTYTTEIPHFTIQKDRSQYVRSRDGVVQWFSTGVPFAIRWGAASYCTLFISLGKRLNAVMLF